MSPRVGGAEALAYALQKAWLKEGLASNVVYVDSTDLVSKGRFSRLRRMMRELREARPDIVVAHSALPAVYSRLAAPRSTRVVSVLHSSEDDFANATLRIAERALRVRTAAVVAVSHSQAEVYVRRFGRRIPVRTIPNGIGDNFHPDIDPGAPQPLLLETARVAKQKAPEVWMWAIRKVLENHPTLRAEWWGPESPDPIYAAAISNLAQQMGVTRVFKGPVKDVAPILRRGLLYVHAAEREAHSVGLLEAAASGLPIVCSDAVGAGVPSWFAVELFHAGDKVSLVDAIERALSNIEALSARAQSVSSRVRSDFSIESCAESYLSLFREQCDGK